MSLVFTAITPHPPLLIPSIGKDSEKKIAKTKKAMEQLEEDLYVSKPDVIVIISPHGHLFKDSFSLNYCHEYISDLKKFGDLATKLKFKGEMTLTYAIRESSKRMHYPTAMISEKALDYGAVVPLYFLTKHLPNTTILPIGFSALDWKNHTDFGYLIKEQIMKTNKRVAVIASCDLSHALTTDAPAGYHPAGEEFDQKIQELLASGNTSGLLQLNHDLVADATECGFRALLILLGILRNIHYTYKSYAYENPFGVGYLTANIIL